MLTITFEDEAVKLTAYPLIERMVRGAYVVKLNGQDVKLHDADGERLWYRVYDEGAGTPSGPVRSMRYEDIDSVHVY